MNAFIKIPINLSIDPESVSDFQLYIVRAKELLDNYEDIKKLGFDFGGGHMLLRDSNGLVTGAEVKVDKHRLKGLFLDFRFLLEMTSPPTSCVFQVQLVGTLTKIHSESI